jgi:hypothetical protein
MLKITFMAQSQNEWKPSQKSLTEAMSDLQEAKKLLDYAQPKSINANVAIEKIDIALETIKAVIFNYF